MFIAAICMAWKVDDGSYAVCRRYNTCLYPRGNRYRADYFRSADCSGDNEYPRSNERGNALDDRCDDGNCHHFQGNMVGAASRVALHGSDFHRAAELAD